MLAANSAFAGCETFLAQCGDPAAILDKQGAVVFANAAWLDLWRSTRHDVLGAPATALHPDFHSLLSELKCADGSHASAQMRLGGQQAALRWISVSLSRVVDAGETCYLAIGSDATSGVSLRRNARLVEMMAEATTRMLVVTDRRGDIAFVNRRFSLGLGFSRAEAIGRKTLDLLAGPFTDLRQFARIRRRLLKNDAARGDLLIYDSSGQETWVHVSARLVRNSRGEPVNYAMMLESIGESRKIRTMQQRVLDAIAKDRPLAEVGDILCKNIVAIAPDVTPSVLRVDGDSLVRPVAGRGLPSELTVAIDGLPIGPTQGSCGAAAYLRRPVLARDIETHPNWTPFREPTLSAGLRACWSSPILAKDGRTLGAFAFYFREKRGPSRWHKKIVAAALDLCALAIDRYEAQAQIERLAYFDSLTDLPNRSRLREKFESLISSQQVERAALLFIDIDNFKDVNDTLGHSTGDELLARVARILKSLVRPQDVLARHGGDEFVVVLPDVDVDGASAFADRVRAALAEPAPLGDTMAPVSLSIGVSIYPDDGRDADTLLTNADSAMYAAKRSGRSTHRLFHPSMRRAAEERVACSRALREAIANDGLVLHYQPQVWSGSGVLRGVEALARWRDPVLGDVSPARFIPIAEEYGLIGAIGEWSLRESARQLALWRSQGLAVPRVSVNLAPALLQGRGLLDTIARNLAEFDLHPDDLTIEITEGALMKDRIAGVEAARALHAFGVSISLDDFGTGYSNLSRLAQLPIDELKIDRSFMSRIADDPDARAVANIAVQIGKALRMTVVAEGVETHEQKRVLQELGCDVQQGYLFARPMPAAHLGTWLLDAGSDARSESAA